jgi:site-specific DNA-methyltransferase (adenine-specific)
VEGSQGLRENRYCVEFTNEWKSVSSRWGHKLHSMCSYMAMFPPNLPHYFIEKCTMAGDVVLDPFCGRGTTPLEACLMGRAGVGSDLNDLAYTLTKAKVNVPPASELHARLAELERGYAVPQYVRPLLIKYNDFLDENAVSPALWEEMRSVLAKVRRSFAQHGEPGMPYYRDEDYEYRAPRSEDAGYTEERHHRIWLFIHPATLHQLVYLRQRLGDSPCDDFIRATLLGIMHGRGRFYLSIPMPNTFSLTPRYVLSYAYNHRLVMPNRDVFSCLRAKMDLMKISSLPETYRPGEAVNCDVRDLPGAMDSLAARHPEWDRPKLLVTSPPYLGVIKYGLYNWIRLWFLDKADTGAMSAGAPRQAATPATITTKTPPIPPQPLDRLIDARLDDGHKDLAGYLAFVREAMAATYRVMDDRCLAAWVIGDVAEKGGPPLNLAEAVWEQAARPEGWHLEGIIVDEVAENRKVTKIWGESRGKATKVDRVLLLYKESLPASAGPVRW